MYKIWGKYLDHPWEEIDEAETEKSANYLLGEYTLAYGRGWKLEIRKGK